MNLCLTGKIALVTGAGSQVGFGKGIALTLAREGCDVIVNDVDEAGANKTAAEIKALGRKSMAIKVDVTKSAEVNDMVAKALKEFGRIDILINNAGKAHAPRPFVQTPEKDQEAVINLNIYGVFNCTRAVLPQMLERKYGKIVNITSGAGLTGMPRCVAYGASKAAIMAFTKGIAKEVISSGINVNSVAPGVGDTNFMSAGGFPDGEINKALATVPTGKATTPEEIGNMIAYLCSDLASNIVGQIFFVDGGHSIR
jgi:NAD(P)-dependent dehydrogenase (short-subunit alcohol dehydrogenase family)